MSGSTQDLPPFAVSQFTTWTLDFERDLEVLAEVGVGHVELCERKLSADAGRAREQLARVAAAGFEITSVQPRTHALYRDLMTPDLVESTARIARYHDSIDRFCDAFPGRTLTFVTITGAAPDHDHRGAHNWARHAYAELADHAAERGARLALEPLSPILMNVDTFVCTVDGAMRLIDEVGRPNFGLALDIWHVWREPGLPERIRALDGRIFAVHVSDWPAGEPRCLADRLVPGAGVIDLAGMFGALEAAYDGAYTLEIFSDESLPDSLWRRPAGEVITASREGFAAAWRARR